MTARGPWLASASARSCGVKRGTQWSAPPRRWLPKRPSTRPWTWNIGSAWTTMSCVVQAHARASMSRFAAMLRRVMMAPLGAPVVPDVYSTRAGERRGGRAALDRERVDAGGAWADSVGIGGDGDTGCGVRKDVGELVIAELGVDGDGDVAGGGVRDQRDERLERWLRPDADAI